MDRGQIPVVDANNGEDLAVAELDEEVPVTRSRHQRWRPQGDISDNEPPSTEEAEMKNLVSAATRASMLPPTERKTTSTKVPSNVLRMSNQ